LVNEKGQTLNNLAYENSSRAYWDLESKYKDSDGPLSKDFWRVVHDEDMGIKAMIIIPDHDKD